MVDSTGRPQHTPARTTVTPPARDALLSFDLKIRGALIVMGGLFALGLALILTSNGRLAEIFFGLHAFQAGLIMVVSVGALQGHRTMVEQEEKTQTLVTQYVARMEDMLDRIVSAAEDEVSPRRTDGHQHEH